jgi:hypothetical protein
MLLSIISEIDNSWYNKNMENNENKKTIESSEKIEVKEVKKPKKTFKQITGTKKVRLWVIIILLAVVAVLFFFFKKARIALAVAFFALLAALGMEVSNKDYDMKTLIETKSFEQSEVQRDSAGNVLYDIFGEITTDSSKGKTANEYNCEDFGSQPEAQTFFEKVGGVGNDVNRLDGDKDGEACESLPKN